MKNFILNFNSRKRLKQRGGFSLVEVVIAVFVVSGVILLILEVGNQTVKRSNILKSKSRAALLAEEAMEAVKSFRGGTLWSDGGVGQLAVYLPYHPDSSGGSWNLVLGEETLGGKFRRSVVFENAFRDSFDDLVLSGGTEDFHTKKVKINVLWTEYGNSYSVGLEAYIMNIFNN